MYWINLIGTTIVSMLASYLFMCNMTDTKYKTIFNKKNLIIYLLLNVVFFLNMLFLIGLNKILINIFIFMLMNLFIIFNLDYRKSLFYSLIIVTISCAVEIVSMIPIAMIFKFSAEDFNNLKLGMLLFSLLNSILLYLISIIKPIKRFINKLYNSINKRIKSFLFFMFIACYIILLGFNNFKILKNDIDSLINFGILVFVVISSIVIAYNTFQKNKTEDKLNQMVEYVSKYEKIINEQGKRNHEFNNQLMVLNGYINDKKKLKEYLELIISEQKGGQNYRIKQLGYLPDGGLKGLIYYKLSKMEERGIKSYLYVSDNLKHAFDNFSVEFYRDITKIFGVFIDNAIDAASESDLKEIELDIKKDDDCLIIVISNTFKSGTDTSKIGKKGYSSKGVGHGFGLSIVKDISKNSDKIETFSDIENNMFKQTLMIYLK